jgi:hypothetical protein
MGVYMIISLIQGTLGLIQRTFGVIQGTFGTIQGTLGIRRVGSIKELLLASAAYLAVHA